MDHTESILHLKKILHPDFIKKIIPLIEKKATENLTIENMIVDKTIRNVKGFTLTFKSVVLFVVASSSLLMILKYQSSFVQTKQHIQN